MTAHCNVLCLQWETWWNVTRGQTPRRSVKQPQTSHAICSLLSAKSADLQIFMIWLVLPKNFDHTQPSPPWTHQNILSEAFKWRRFFLFKLHQFPVFQIIWRMFQDIETFSQSSLSCELSLSCLGFDWARRQYWLCTVLSLSSYLDISTFHNDPSLPFFLLAVTHCQLCYF